MSDVTRTDEEAATPNQVDTTGPDMGLEKTEVDPYATAYMADPVAGEAGSESSLEDSLATQAIPTGSFERTGLASTQTWDQGPGGNSNWSGTGAHSRYRALRLHARGGLGEIFLAVDGELNREVALKEIQEKHGDRLDSQFRFVFEAEVTGGLEHPGIVPVYGLGRYADGRPYYAMRFIRGDTLKVAIRRLHGSLKGKRDALAHSLEFRKLLSRFVAVCQAIDYAHSRGVIHRDIKPDNVMLGPHGETLVVDWGLAKALNRPEPPPDHFGPKPLRPLSGTDGSATMEGSVIGTPSYMSPEQAAGEVETLGPGSDIFSLGSTLYDLLTNQTPFRGKGLTEIIESVRIADFPAPRAVNPSVPAPLDAICRKAMALRSADRYPTAGELAVDLERWLADEPVTAYPEPFTARVSRWGRRHRTSVAVGLALILTASTGLAISHVLISREKARTERNFVRARSAVEEMLNKVGEVELADVPQMEPVRRDLLDKALKFYLEFLAERGNDAWSRLETGRAYVRLGDIREMLGLYTQSEANYRAAIGLLERLVDGPDADPHARRGLARAQAGLGVLLKKSGRSLESEALLRRALEGRKALASEFPDDQDDARALAATRYQLGTLLARLKDRGAEDESAYRSAIEEQEALIARPEATLEARRELARYLNNLGILQAGAEPDKAEATFRRAMKIQDELEAQSLGNAGFRWQRARTRNNLAILLSRAGQVDDAGPLYDQARTGLDSLSADFPSVPDYRREEAMTLNNLGLLREVKPAEGELPLDLFRRALDDQRRLALDFPEVPDHRQKLAITCIHLGDLLRTSEPAEADAFLQEAVSLTSKLAAEHPEVPEYQAALGRASTERALMLRGLNRGDEAANLLISAIRSLELAREGNPREATYDRFLVEAHNDRAETLLKLGRHAELATEAGQLAEVLPDRPEPRLAAAKYLVRAMDLASADPALAVSKRVEARESYARGAVKEIRRALEKGPDGAQALDDPGFAPLKGRADFEKLRDDLKKGPSRARV
ncbi:protein kinase domain-containing protein [Tundrisphaera lichenicola]|uniref:protein kinase domain-containing protein n=1 Tax=Tundrisphaera lichenicola TaxID=2029860 RepID=UPI003EC02F52